MSSRGSTEASPTTKLRMPPPRAMFKIMNPLMKFMLLAPFHGRMSQRLMMLTLRGRKTGKRYSAPVCYARSGAIGALGASQAGGNGKAGSILVFTHSAWRNKFKQPAPVTMRIQGKEVHGIGQLVTDPARIKQIVRDLMSTNGEEMSRRMNLWADNVENATPEEVQQATQGTYYIEIKVKP